MQRTNGGSVAKVLVAMAVLTTPAVAGERARDRVTHEILGVGIGTSLEQARKKLDRLGRSAERGTRSGGRKLAWTLERTDYHTVALKTDRQGKVVWISAFHRDESRPRFDEIGDPDRADRMSDVQAIWNVVPRRGGAYRLVAKGAGGRASVVYLLKP